MPYLYKPFILHHQHYVYDVNTNSIIGITLEQYQSLNSVLSGTAIEDDIHKLVELQHMGYCKETNIGKIEHPYSKTFPDMLDRRIEKM